MPERLNHDLSLTNAVAFFLALPNIQACKCTTCACSTISCNPGYAQSKLFDGFSIDQHTPRADSFLHHCVISSTNAFALRTRILSAMDRRTGKPLMNFMFLSGLGAPLRLISLALLKVPHGGAQCTQKTSGFSSNPFRRERPSLLQRSSFMTFMPEALQMWSTGTALQPSSLAALLSLASPQKTSTKIGVRPEAADERHQPHLLVLVTLPSCSLGRWTHRALCCHTPYTGEGRVRTPAAYRKWPSRSPPPGSIRFHP